MADSRVYDAVDAVARHAIAINAVPLAHQVAGMVMVDFTDAGAHVPAIEARIVELLTTCDSGEDAAVAASEYLATHPAGEVQ